MPTEMPTIVWVSGHSTDHSSDARWKQEGQIEEENPTGTGPCAVPVGPWRKPWDQSFHPFKHQQAHSCVGGAGLCSQGVQINPRVVPAPGGGTRSLLWKAVVTSE